jgi:hypothetical protein
VEGGGPPVRPLTELEADEARMRMLVELQASTRRPGVPGGDPVLAVSEVRKPDSQRKRLALADVRGHARLVYDAHCVLLLEPQADGAGLLKEVVPVVLNVAKVRDGGRRGDIHLDFHHTVSLFKERGPDPKGTGTPTSEEAAEKQQGGKAKKRFSGK